MTILTLACFILFFGRLAIADYVPVIICGPNIQYKSPVALKSHNSDEFIAILNERVTSDTIIFVIAEDQLSIEDLSQCKTPNGHICFQGIQQIKTKLYLPSVEDPIAVIEDIVGLNKFEVNLLSNGDMSEPFNPEWGKYFFINFEDSSSDELKSAKLSSHDQIVTKLYNELSSQNSEIVFIFTGKNAEQQKRFVREAISPEVKGGESNKTEVSSASATFWKSERLLLYYTELSLRNASGKQPINIKNMTVIAADKELTVTLSTNVVSSNNVTNNDTINFTSSNNDTFNFIVYGDIGGSWWVKNFTWRNETLFPNRQISAVDKFSFHCSPEIHFGTSNKAESVEIIWKGLQLQPEFGSVDGKSFESFGDAWDCVGFVSPALLSGLLITFIVIFVLFIGIGCIMNIKTNDRFDDPKKIITFGRNE